MFSSGDFTSQRAHMPGQPSNDSVNLLPSPKLCSFPSQGCPTAPRRFTASDAPRHRTAQRAAKMRAHPSSDSQSTPSSVTQKAFPETTALPLCSRSHTSLSSVRFYDDLGFQLPIALHARCHLGVPQQPPPAPPRAAAVGCCAAQCARTWLEQPSQDALTA